MDGPQRWWGLGRRIAPPRFVMFVLLFVLGLPALIAATGSGRGVMLAFDIAAAVFLVSLIPLLRHGEAATMRAAAHANDANRALLLALTAATMLVILAAVHGELHGRNDTTAIVLVIATLVLAWTFSNVVWALHYAHLFYAEAEGAGGLDFPETKQPDYWDFVYFSFTLGMTFQTSDVTITSGKVRRVVTGQSLAAFVFNLGVLAFTINTLGGG